MNLEQLIKNSGVKKYKLAEYLGISRQQLRNIENGQCRIDSGKIEVLSKKLNIEPLLILKAWEESNRG